MAVPPCPTREGGVSTSGRLTLIRSPFEERGALRHRRYFGINCCRRSGSSPSHCGLSAVPSNRDEVLNGSY